MELWNNRRETLAHVERIAADDAAVLLGVCLTTLNKLTKSGIIRPEVIGGVRVFNTRELLRDFFGRDIQQEQQQQ